MIVWALFDSGNGCYTQGEAMEIAKEQGQIIRLSGRLTLIFYFQKIYINGAKHERLYYMALAIHILVSRHRLSWCGCWIILWCSVESVLLGGVI